MTNSTQEGEGGVLEIGHSERNRINLIDLRHVVLLKDSHNPMLNFTEFEMFCNDQKFQGNEIGAKPKLARQSHSLQAIPFWLTATCITAF